MDTTQLAGLCLDLIGVVLLAVAEHRRSRVVDLFLVATDTTVGTLVGGGDVVRFVGLDEVQERTLRRAGVLSRLGWVLLVVGFAAQIASGL